MGRAAPLAALAEAYGDMMHRDCAAFLEQLPEQVNAFAESAEKTSLYLLKAVEVAVDNLGTGENLTRALADEAKKLAESIASTEAAPECLIDPDDEAIDDLEAGIRSLESLLPRVVSKKATVADALSEDQRSRWHAAFECFEDAVAALIECLKELRAAVITHDMKAERAGARKDKPFESIDELIASLRS